MNDKVFNNEFVIIGKVIDRNVIKYNDINFSKLLLEVNNDLGEDLEPNNIEILVQGTDFSKININRKIAVTGHIEFLNSKNTLFAEAISLL